MTVRRWATTTAVMAAVGLVLWSVAPASGAARAALADPQGLVDTQGPDALLVLLAWVLAAVCWAWGTVGLLLTVAGAGRGPGARAARALLTVVLPAGLRQAAAVAVGLSLATAPAVALGAPGAPTTVVDTAALDSTAPSATSWSDVGTASPSAPVPDWPVAAGGDHVVQRGDCLWDVAAAWLAPRGPATDAQVAAGVQAWWETNAEVIGPDPDLLLPGQVLHAPPTP